MKITLENPSRMVLKDHNYQSFFFGFVFFCVGVAIAYFLRGESLLVVGVGAVFALAGFWVIASAKMVTVVLDKGSGTCTVKLLGLLGSGTRDVQLARVRKLNLKKFISTTNSSKGSSTTYEYVVSLAMDGGEEISFKLANVSASITDVLKSPDEKQKDAAKRIADFIGVPFEFIPPPSMLGTFKEKYEGIAEGMDRMAK